VYEEHERQIDKDNPRSVESPKDLLTVDAEPLTSCYVTKEHCRYFLFEGEWLPIPSESTKVRCKRWMPIAEEPALERMLVICGINEWAFVTCARGPYIERDLEENCACLDMTMEEIDHLLQPGQMRVYEVTPSFCGTEEDGFSVRYEDGQLRDLTDKEWNVIRKYRDMTALYDLWNDVESLVQFQKRMNLSDEPLASLW
jgi:hypothetical protein